MKKLFTEYGTSQYSHKGYVIGESHVFGHRTWNICVQGLNHHFGTIREAKEWIDNRVKLFNC